MKQLILIALIFFSTKVGIAQNAQYEVILMGKKIGDVHLTKETDTHGDRYKMQSESHAKVMFVKKSSTVNFDVLFKGGALVESFYSSKKEGDNIVTRVNKASDTYRVVSNEKESSLKESIDFSSIMLYFKEPIGITQVFVERIGDFIPLKKLSEGEYSYLQPDGTTSIYRYLQGKLVEIQLKRGVGSVFIRPV